MFKTLGILLLLSSFASYGAGYSTWGVPKKIEYVNNGLLVSGSFGDVNSCGQKDYVFIIPNPNDENWFDSTRAMVLMAFASGKEIRFYSKKCIDIGFHWGESEVINQAHVTAFYIRD